VSLIPWQAWAGLFGLVCVALFWWWLTRTLRRQGAMQRDLSTAEANVKVKNAQLEIAARPVSDADVRDRLRDGTF
jgi:hypothetical protein